MRDLKFADFIGVFPELVPQKLCKELINLHSKLDKIGGTQAGRTGGGVVKRSKVSIDVEISRYAIAQDILAELNKYMDEAFKIYKSQFWVLEEMMGPYDTTAWQLQKYSAQERGGYYQFHHEVSSKLTCNRTMTYILYLNDIDEGGETEFLFQNIRVKPEAGKLIYFPAYYTHVHRGNPVLSNQDKYIVTGWMEFV
jgi:Rps23 Pro-64 3,4-dihydroxylase Tpa1-like proline 4-hydroxylase